MKRGRGASAARQALLATKLREQRLRAAAILSCTTTTTLPAYKSALRHYRLLKILVGLHRLSAAIIRRCCLCQGMTMTWQLLHCAGRTPTVTAVTLRGTDMDGHRRLHCAGRTPTVTAVTLRGTDTDGYTARDGHRRLQRLTLRGTDTDGYTVRGTGTPTVTAVTLRGTPTVTSYGLLALVENISLHSVYACGGACALAPLGGACALWRALAPVGALAPFGGRLRPFWSHQSLEHLECGR
jgi:hypothetical protein